MSGPVGAYLQEYGHLPRPCEPFCNHCGEYPNQQCPACGHRYHPNPPETETSTMAKKTKSLLDVPVAFGSVTIGDGSVSIAIMIDRENINPETADGLLCGCRVKGEIRAGAPSQPAQEMLFDDLEFKQVGMFEIKGYSVRPKTIRATLNMLLKEVDTKELEHFAKHSGRFRIEAAAPLEAD